MRVDGPIWITGRARRATLSGVYLSSSSSFYSIPLKVQADRARVIGNVIKGRHSTNCVLVGSHRRARGVLLEGNRIERCGRSGKFDHLIYIAYARDTVVRGNLLLNNSGGWAVHLYPDADGTLVERNVVDNNLGGVVFAGDGTGHTSDRNLVRNNAITGAGPRWNIESSWSGGPAGIGNSAHHNCLRQDGPLGPAGIGEPIGFSAGTNAVLAGLPYVNRLLRDYRFRRRSPCTMLVGELVSRLTARLR